MTATGTNATSVPATLYLFPAARRVRPPEACVCALTPEIAASAVDNTPLRVFHGTRDRALSRAITELAASGIVTLRQLAGLASADLARLKAWTFSKLDALLKTFAQDYKAENSGTSGNVTLTSYDRRYKLVFTRQSRIAFGPEIEVAGSLLTQWVKRSDGSAELKALILDAFRLDDQGRVKTDEVLRLRRHNISGELWERAMKAIGDAMITAAKKNYVPDVIREICTGAEFGDVVPARRNQTRHAGRHRFDRGPHVLRR